MVGKTMNGYHYKFKINYIKSNKYYIDVNRYILDYIL